MYKMKSQVKFSEMKNLNVSFDDYSADMYSGKVCVQLVILIYLDKGSYL
jgi:hypothetical protein